MTDNLTPLHPREGLKKIKPSRKDYSLLHTFGVTGDPSSLPDNFSIYDGRPIPNQDYPDTRFDPPVKPLLNGCTAEALTFQAGLQNNTTYRPDDFYYATLPYDDGGRDIRVAMQTAIDRGFKRADGTFDKELAYFNCYGSGKIDDFDAARIAIWINQAEKRGVIIGSWWYWGDTQQKVLPTPSFNMKEADLHCYLGSGWQVSLDAAVGWQTIDGKMYLEIIASTGALLLMERDIFNALMAQPWTGCFTITNKPSNAPVPIGWVAIVDHLTYFIRSLFHI